MIVIVIDCETDGIGSFRPPNQRPIQLGIVIGKINSNCSYEILEEKSIFISGVSKINPKAYQVHKLSLELINQNGVGTDIVDSYLNDIILKYTSLSREYGCKLLLLGHNLEFDLGCMKKSLKIDIYKKITEKYDRVFKFCTMTCKEIITKCKLPFANKNIHSTYDRYKYPKLEELASILKINEDGEFHDAVTDCRVTFKCLVKCLKKKWIN